MLKGPGLFGYAQHAVRARYCRQRSVLCKQTRAHAATRSRNQLSVGAQRMLAQV